jgi:hypothetical protein
VTRTRLFGWWRLAETAVASVTSPRTDVAASDHEVEGVFRTSWLFAAGRACGAVIGAAWRDSITHNVVSRIEREAIGSSGPQRVRGVATMAVIAVPTSLALQVVTPGAIGPLTGVLPVAVAACALAAIMWAEPIARALADRKP